MFILHPFGKPSLHDSYSHYKGKKLLHLVHQKPDSGTKVVTPGTRNVNEAWPEPTEAEGTNC